MATVEDLLSRLDTAVNTLQENEGNEDAAVAAKLEPVVAHVEMLAQHSSTPQTPQAPQDPSATPPV